MDDLVRSFKLDDAQRDVVESYAKDIIVVAGSGSGKTRVLVERIKNLVINRGVRPVDSDLKLRRVIKCKRKNL